MSAIAIRSHSEHKFSIRTYWAARLKAREGEDMRIVVTGRIPEAALVVLRAAGEVWTPAEDRALTPDELRKAVHGASAIVSMLHDHIDGSVADAAGPGLWVVANVAVGYDNVDVAALAQRNVVVTNTPGVLTDATADLTFGLLLALTRRIGEGERLLRARRPWSFHLGFMLGSGLQSKTLGIIGLGQIGQAVARRARAFDMHIVYSGRSRSAAETELEARYLSKDELLSTADVVSLHCPLTPETRHLIDTARCCGGKSRAPRSTCSRTNPTSNRGCWRWTTWCSRRTSARRPSKRVPRWRCSRRATSCRCSRATAR
jgi:lactate dehydrogenase-like 2-hydroxyacid dehydrogenase